MKKATATELAFVEYWLRKTERDDSEKTWYILNRALGTLWEKDDFAVKEKTYETKVLERVWYPLSLLLAQTDIKKSIKKDFTQNGQQIGGGEYTKGENEEVVSLGQASKEQFLDFLQRFGGPVTDKIANTTPKK